MAVDPDERWPPGAVGFDVAQVCLNGHVVNDAFLKKPNRRRVLCPQCQAKTIIECPECEKGIKGTLHGGVEPYEYRLPDHCTYCGARMPWARNGRIRRTEVGQRRRAR